MTHVSERDFSQTTVEVADELYQLATELHNQYGNQGSLVLRENLETICFGVNKGDSREERESGKRLYRVSVEPVKPSLRKFVVTTRSESGDHYIYFIEHKNKPSNADLKAFLREHASDKDDDTVYEYVQDVVEVTNYQKIPVKK